MKPPSRLSTACASKLAKEPGANLFLMAVQDIRVGGRQANASYQYTLLSDDLAALREWEPKIRKALAALPQLADVNSDQQDNGAEMDADLRSRHHVTSGDRRRMPPTAC